MPARKRSRKNFKPHWVLNLIIALVVLIGISFSYLVFSSKENKYPADLSTPAINLPGTYQGNLPCADCPGITETLTLTATDSAQTKGSYVIEDLYQEKSPMPLKSQGTWEITSQTILKLNPKDASPANYFEVLTNGNLQTLDNNMQKIDSPFSQILIKLPISK